MHGKWLKHGKGSASRAIQYLLGDLDHLGSKRAEVKVLRGDPHRVARVADSLEFRHKYRSFVLSFAPTDNPTPQQIDEVLDMFERVAFGKRADRFAYTAVLHREDDGTPHIHIIVARVDLATGKSFNPSPPGWQNTYDPMRDYFNLKYDWARPDDPARARALNKPNDLPHNAKALRELINTHIIQAVELGIVANRDDVVRYINQTFGDLGVKVARETKKSISLAVPGREKNVRLTGEIYGRDFNADTAAYRREGTGATRIDAANRRKRVEELGRELDRIISKRDQYIRKRYDRGNRQSKTNDKREDIRYDDRPNRADRELEPAKRAVGERSEPRQAGQQVEAMGDKRHDDRGNSVDIGSSIDYSYRPLRTEIVKPEFRSQRKGDKERRADNRTNTVFAASVSQPARPIHRGFSETNYAGRRQIDERTTRDIVARIGRAVEAARRRSESYARATRATNQFVGKLGGRSRRRREEYHRLIAHYPRPKRENYRAIGEAAVVRRAIKNVGEALKTAVERISEFVELTSRKLRGGRLWGRERGRRGQLRWIWRSRHVQALNVFNQVVNIRAKMRDNRAYLPVLMPAKNGVMWRIGEAEIISRNDYLTSDSHVADFSIEPPKNGVIPFVSSSAQKGKAVCENAIDAAICAKEGYEAYYAPNPKKAARIDAQIYIPNQYGNEWADKLAKMGKKVIDENSDITVPYRANWDLMWDNIYREEEAQRRKNENRQSFSFRM
jgi:hypothetical protein